VGLLTIHSPPVNILTAELLRELGVRIGTATADPTVRVLVLASGVDKAFAAGASIREMRPLGPGAADRHAVLGQSITRQIEECPIPVIAAVHGACLGGGSEIVEACDFVLASDDATFGQPEINIGVMPGWGGTQRLPRRVGAQQARAWVLLGRPVDARTAHEHGLVWKVVPRPDLLEEAMRLASELALKPAKALASAKQALNAAIDRGRDGGLALERRLWSKLFGTPDQIEGMTAFLEKRVPVFSGREASPLRTPHRSRTLGARREGPRRRLRPHPGRRRKSKP
jgi:enoyl-CoA hydratase